MSPTVLRVRGFRFYFFSREEPRPHVHVQSPDGEAKFWLEPKVELAHNYRLSARDLRHVEEVIGKNEELIRDAWNRHFPS